MFKLFSRITLLISTITNLVVSPDDNSKTPSDESDLISQGQISKEQGYEVTDADVFGLSMAGIVLVIGAVCLQLILMSGFFYLKRLYVAPEASSLSTAFATSLVIAPVPADFLNSSSPEKELSDYQQKMDQILNSYGWVSQTQGIVRIPVDQAMKRLSHEK